MRHRLFLVATLTGITLVGYGCGGSDTDSSSSPSAQRFISLGSAPPGGAFFVVGGALAEVLNQHAPGWEVTSEATKGSQENIRRLDSGELDLALLNSSITYFAVRGEGSWQKPYPLRTVMTLAPNVALFITPESSGVRTIADLRDKRVVVGPAGAGWEAFVSPIVEAHGLTYDDFTPLNNTQSGSVDMLADGSAVAAILGGAVPTASIVQAATSQDILMVPFDPEARRNLIAEYPFFYEQTIPAGTYRGQRDDYQGLDVGSMHLVTTAGAGDDLVYEITKAIYESRENVARIHPAGLAINPGNVVRNTGVEFHPGAIRYFREIGIWPQP